MAHCRQAGDRLTSSASAHRQQSIYVQSITAAASAAQSTNVQSTNVQFTTAQSTNVLPTAVQSTRISPATFDPSTGCHEHPATTCRSGQGRAYSAQTWNCIRSNQLMGTVRSANQCNASIVRLAVIY